MPISRTRWQALQVKTRNIAAGGITGERLAFFAEKLRCQHLRRSFQSRERLCGRLSVIENQRRDSIRADQLRVRLQGMQQIALKRQHVVCEKGSECQQKGASADEHVHQLE